MSPLRRAHRGSRNRVVQKDRARSLFYLRQIVHACTIPIVTDHVQLGTEAIRLMASAVALTNEGGTTSARECALAARRAIDQFLGELVRATPTIPAPDTINAPPPEGAPHE